MKMREISVIHELEAIYREFQTRASTQFGKAESEGIGYVREKFRGLEISAENIFNLAQFILPRHSNEIKDSYPASLFLSLCIDRCVENEILIYSGCFTDNLNIFTFDSPKKVYCVGNLGEAAGLSLDEGAKLTIIGNVGDLAGRYLSGGILEIHGDAGRQVGDDMTEGEIRLMRNYKSLGNLSGGKVYHKFKKIAEGGIKLLR